MNQYHKTKHGTLYKMLDGLEQALYDERIWDIDNGILYCKQCHILHHSNLKLQMEIDL